MTLICSIISFITVILLNKKEKRNGILFTPMFSLAFFYSLLQLVVAVYDILLPQSHMIMSPLVPCFSTMFILIFWMCGKGVVAVKGDIKMVSLNSKKEFRVKKLLNLIIVLSIFIIIIFMVLDKSLLKSFSTAQFKSFFSHGVVAHIINLLSVSLIIDFSIPISSKWDIIKRGISIIWIAVLGFVNAKYSMFMYAISLVISYTVTHRRISIVKIFIVIMLLGGGFFFVYAGRMIVDENYSISTLPYDFIFGHFMYYLAGGYYAFSATLTGLAPSHGGLGSELVLAPLYNIKSLFLGEEYVSSTSAFIDVNLPGGYSSTNVFTLFGVLKFEMGMVGTIVFLCVISIIVYSLFCSLNRNRNGIIVPIYSYMCSTLFFSFFNCFYGMANIWETLLIMMIIYFINGDAILQKNRIKQKRSTFIQI